MKNYYDPTVTEEAARLMAVSYTHLRLSTLLRFATEIKEMDINPLRATEKYVIAVDARIRIEKK